MELFSKKYVSIYYRTDILYVHSFSIKYVNPFKNAYLKEIDPFLKIWSTAVKVDKKDKF